MFLVSSYWKYDPHISGSRRFGVKLIGEHTDSDVYDPEIMWPEIPVWSTLIR
jgi:hypothetical protein